MTVILECFVVSCIVYSSHVDEIIVMKMIITIVTYPLPAVLENLSVDNFSTDHHSIVASVLQTIYSY